MPLQVLKRLNHCPAVNLMSTKTRLPVFIYLFINSVGPKLKSCAVTENVNTRAQPADCRPAGQQRRLVDVENANFHCLFLNI